VAVEAGALALVWRRRGKQHAVRRRERKRSSPRKLLRQHDENGSTGKATGGRDLAQSEGTEVT